jgi:hypothetical protein
MGTMRGYIAAAGGRPKFVAALMSLPASKGCVVRILKGKVERTQNHQWPPASRMRATLEEEIPG